MHNIVFLKQAKLTAQPGPSPEPPAPPQTALKPSAMCQAHVQGQAAAGTHCCLLPRFYSEQTKQRLPRGQEGTGTRPGGLSPAR